jgi:hypothetical protein
MSDELPGRGQRYPNPHEREHDLDPPDDADRFDELPGIPELRLLSTTAIGIVAGGPELPGEAVAQFMATVMPAGISAAVSLVIPLDVIDELLDDLVRLRVGPVD